MAINMNYFLIMSCLIELLIIIHPSLAQRRGFTSDLIHRDYSPSSPSYNSSLSKYERLSNSIRRSMSKIRRSPGGMRSQAHHVKGEYYMELSFGTPPVSQLGIVDTGSDLIWAQCQPCSQCYPQDLPIFDSRNSSTYAVQSCGTGPCLSLGSSHTCTRDKKCYYTYQYADLSYTAGYLATETISFKSSGDMEAKWFPNIVFGCSQNNGGNFAAEGSGIVGLGGGPLSLVSQLGSSIGGKFSYCLIPFDKEGAYTSKISFGSIGEVSGPGVISTPMVKRDPSTYYYVTLTEIRVGNTKIPFYRNFSTNADTGREGNIIIDAGATLTSLPSDMYEDLSTALEKVIQGKKVEDPTSAKLGLCYQTGNGGADLVIPDITAHFTGGDMVWKPFNTFTQVSGQVMCLAMLPSDTSSSLGNIAQLNFLVGYDTVAGKVSFRRTDCSIASI